MTKKMNDAFSIRNTQIRSRICIPPMVIPDNADENGFITDRAVPHYISLAKGQPGLLIQEATCIAPTGKLGARQIGIWCDEQIEGNRRIAEAVHACSVPIVMQIHHAGLVTYGAERVGPADFTWQAGETIRSGRSLTHDEVCIIIQQFIDAGRRAYQAGYDGVELHGCHSYLLCQFFNRTINTRTDEFADPMNVVRPIVEGIRAATDENFIIGIRLGAYEPTLEDGIANAVRLDGLVDFINVSNGFGPLAQTQRPEGFPFNELIYGAAEVKKHVKTPVFAVNLICAPEDAAGVLALTDVDMACVARSALVDPDWPRKALSGEIPGKCLHCKVCQWRIEPARCAGKILMARRKEQNA